MINANNLREEYHSLLFENVLYIDKSGIPNNADKSSPVSVALSKSIVEKIGISPRGEAISGQTVGSRFEKITSDYIEKCFRRVNHLRPGNWKFSCGGRIDDFEQYEHLSRIVEVLKKEDELRAAFGDYLIKPDIVVSRFPVEDSEINMQDEYLDTDGDVAIHTPLRLKNSGKSILHASISCKWTIRSDRSQNARTEGLNLIRNRKGKTPHISIVTAEPTPQRIASLALGTGDIDCVYHFALKELKEAAYELEDQSSSKDMVDILISGKRLRDISDLVFDLMV